MKKNIGLIAIVLGVLCGAGVFYTNFKAEDLPVPTEYGALEHTTTASDVIPNPTIVTPIIQSEESGNSASETRALSGEYRFDGRFVREISDAGNQS